MEQLDQWAELVTKFSSAEFPREDFCQTALRLHQLEVSSGKPFEILTGEYEKTKESLDHLTIEVNSLVTKKKQMAEEIKPLSVQVNTLTKERTDLESQRKVLIKQSDELKAEVIGREKERSGLTKEMKELKQRKTQLSAEVDGKEHSLTRLNNIGFLDEDLIRLRTIIERIANDNHADAKEIKEKFFIALGFVKDVNELDKVREAKMENLQQLDEKKYQLEGEILGLENRKAVLLGEIGQASELVTGQIKGIGEKATSELQLQVENIRGSFNALITDAITTAGVISDMKAEVTKVEKSEKGLRNFIAEVKTGLGRNS